MSMRMKAMLVLVIFSALVFLPFSVQAAKGHIFSGLPVPILNDSAADVNDAASDQYGAGFEQYAESLPRPALAGVSAQYQLSIEDMRNHMNILKKEGYSTNQCLACHSNKEEFCDRCHGYVGANPTFDPPDGD
ncbi:MAG: hypothetical protein IBX61_05585 [Thermoleophilia bacterium]|nr:hypothetical protein [Thermoleophilia bacterium]